MKILHTADIHLKKYQDDRWDTLVDLIETGKKEKVSLFIISGDLFDREVEAEALKPKIRGLFSQNGFKVILIPGNHDRESYSRGDYYGENTVTLTDLYKPYECDELRVWGLPFEPIEGEEILRKFASLGEKLKKDKTNILLYHGELLDSFFSRRDFGEEGDVRYMPVKLSYFKDLNFDYVLAGHFHSKFSVWELEGGGYFVYPGSPVSITRRETGRRKVNIFDTGKPPKEYLLDTPHFEEFNIDLNPFEDKDPVKIIREYLDGSHPAARIILTLGGYMDSRKINMTEKELALKIEEIIEGKSAEVSLEYRDINSVFENGLLEDLTNKLKEKNLDQIRRRHLLDIAVKAMIGVTE